MNRDKAKGEFALAEMRILVEFNKKFMEPVYKLKELSDSLDGETAISALLFVTETQTFIRKSIQTLAEIVSTIDDPDYKKYVMREGGKLIKDKPDMTAEEIDAEMKRVCSKYN